MMELKVIEPKNQVGPVIAKVDLHRAQEIGHRLRPVVLVEANKAQAVESLSRVRPAA